MTIASELRLAASTFAAAARLARSAGLAVSFSPVAATRFARDTIRRGRRGAASLYHLHALTDPLRPAVVCGAQRYSYGELDARINLLAHGLRRLGIGPGDRLALFVHNCAEYFELNAALGYLGAIAVQIGYRLKAPEVAYILKNASPRGLVFHKDLATVAGAALAEARVPGREAAVSIGHTPGFLSYEELLLGGDPDQPPPKASDDTGGVMIYTSGTTGRPKGARRDFKETHLETIIHFLSLIPIHRNERHLVVCPLYHSAAPAFAAFIHALGGCVVVLPHFDPEEVLRTIERERITSTLMVPTLFARLLELGLPALRRFDLSSLRWLMSAAAPLPTELARRIELAFGPILYNMYGATETGIVALAAPGEHTARPGTIGRIVPGNEARLLDAEGEDVAEGQVGELYIRSRMMMQGYHGDEEATRKASREGYFSVGDLAWRDGDGYYYLADRKNDMVISAGVNIYPLEIEQRLHDHPAVADAAVVGVPDPEWGESLVAFIVLRAGMKVTAEELRAHVAATLADYKKPRKVLFVESLPRNPTGKVLKRELRASLAAEAAS